MILGMGSSFLLCGQNIKKLKSDHFQSKWKSQDPSHAISIQIHTMGGIKQQQKNARLQYIKISQVRGNEPADLAGSLTWKKKCKRIFFQ